jgi:hypothetical protein
MTWYKPVVTRIKKEWPPAQAARISVLTIATVAFALGAWGGFKAADVVLRERLATFQTLLAQDCVTT